jgi:hypothetical protein
LHCARAPCIFWLSPVKDGDAMGQIGDTKTCTVCGRAFAWRRSWAAKWSTLQHCSAACRRRRLGIVDRKLEQAILHLLRHRPTGTTIGLQDVAEQIGQVRASDVRVLLPRCRDAARRLNARGLVDFCQGGEIVDASHAHGPVRLRRREG